MRRPGWDVDVRTFSEVTAEKGDFVTTHRVVAEESGKTVFERTWERRIPRTAS